MSVWLMVVVGYDAASGELYTDGIHSAQELLDQTGDNIFSNFTSSHRFRHGQAPPCPDGGDADQDERNLFEMVYSTIPAA
ncbi:hypothetical protein Hypma_002829 [Hypsizygus marmoreus]|uniref:Uncharacterized protein n=1 Tax=Hypsizygus marmoreus TaxID=39966 RepID=A0A369JAV8_HYPMA|nr:hypothetical protein Hypma_002829 [Hypsizygus marmoreus]